MTTRRRTVTAAGGALLLAVAATLGAAAPAAATYEGQVGRLAWGSFDVASGRTQADIWSARPDGSGLRRLTTAAGRDICPAYSADGKGIAFCSDRTGAFEIWAMDHNGMQERRLTTLAARATFPDVSPDGQWVVFTSEASDGNADLWLVPWSGGVATRLTTTTDVAEEVPAWSPDGTTVLFVGRADDGAQLWTLDVASGERRQLTFDATAKDQTPDWSPDGSRIAYGADDDVWLMDADGSDQVNLTDSAVSEFGAAFSPRGDQIAFTGGGDGVPAGERYVQVIRLDGTDRRVVAPTPGLLQAVPGWQPLGAGR